MKLKTLISLFLALSVAISCSKVSFTPTPTQACQDATSCTVGPNGETLYQNLSAALPNTQVDILFIVDNSLSMIQIQQNLASHFPGFVQSLTGLQWRIAIATTDVTSLPTTNTWINGLPQYDKDHKNGNLVPFLIPSGSGFTRTNQYYIDNSTPNAQTLFQATIQRPESNACASHISSATNKINAEIDCEALVSGDERGIYAAMLNVSGQNPNNFLRSSAQFHVIVVSNEDERTNGGGFIPINDPSVAAPGYPIVPGQDNPQDFVGLFNGSKKAVKFHTIAELPSTGTFNFETCVSDQIFNFVAPNYNGCFYIQTSKLTNGVIESINTTNYTPAFTNIAASMQDTSIHSYSLNCTPTSVIVHSQSGVPMPAGYFDGEMLFTSGSTINFNPAIAPGTGIQLEWTCPNH